MRKILFFIGVFLVLSLSSAQGEVFDLSGLQPSAPYGVFSTLSANSPERGKAAVTFSAEKSGKPDFIRLSSQLAYGITNSVEFSANIPYIEDSRDGLEDISFGLKHRFFNEGRRGPSMAYVLTVAIDSGDERLGTEGSYGAGLILSKRVGPVNGHLNALFGIPGKSGLEGDVRVSAGIDFSAAHSFKILGELYGEKTYLSDEIDRLEARLGYRFVDSDEDLFTTVGVGFGINGRNPDYRLMASLSLLFPRHEKPVKKASEEGR